MINSDKYYLEQTLEYQLPTKSGIAHEKTYGISTKFHGKILSPRQNVMGQQNGLDISDVYYLSCLEVLPRDTLIIDDDRQYTVVELYRKAGRNSKINFYSLKVM